MGDIQTWDKEWKKMWFGQLQEGLWWGVQSLEQFGPRGNFNCCHLIERETTAAKERIEIWGQFRGAGWWFPSGPSLECMLKAKGESWKGKVENKIIPCKRECFDSLAILLFELPASIKGGTGMTIKSKRGHGFENFILTVARGENGTTWIHSRGNDCKWELEWHKANPFQS